MMLAIFRPMRLLPSMKTCRIEIAGSRYGTERTIENADAFFEAVYDVKLKEIDKPENEGEKTE